MYKMEWSFSHYLDFFINIVDFEDAYDGVDLFLLLRIRIQIIL